MDIDRQTKLALQAFAEQLNRLAPEIQMSMDGISHAVAAIDWERIQGIAARATASYQAALIAMAPALEKMQQAVVQLPPRMRRALLTLARHGWYLDPAMDFSDLWVLEQALSAGDVIAGEQALCEYFEAQLEAVEEAICEQFPARARLFQLAFTAHRRTEYGLSIPLLLSQTDGMCKEVLDQQLFSRRKGVPRTAEIVAQLEVDGFCAALLAPLTEPLPISASEYERGEDFAELNRHMVLHGESVDFDTRTNSLKAISLANYIAVVVKSSGNL